MSYDPKDVPTPEASEEASRLFEALRVEQTTDELRADLIARGIDADDAVDKGREIISRRRPPSVAAWVVEVWHPSQGWVAQTRPANSSRTRFWDDWDAAQSESAAYAREGHLSRVVALEPSDDTKPFPASAYAALGEAEHLRDERATLRREILTAIEAMAGAKTALAEFGDRDRALELLDGALAALVPSPTVVAAYQPARAS